LGVPVATIVETDLLEENPHPVCREGDAAVLTFRPFEIKTLRCEL
jgi:hypothetical protein